MSIRTRAVTAAATLVVAVVLPVLGAGQAEAVTYRYWTYWWGDGTATSHTGWKFASVGPSGQTVADQAVLGWRFATTSAAGTTRPRYASSYSSICSDPKPANGDVRVAVVVDYGSSSDWPKGETPPVVGKVYTQCIILPAGTRASTAMSVAHLDLRTGGNGLICGINGFPAAECAPVIADPTPTPTPTHTATHPPTARPTPAPTTATSRPTGAGATPATAVASTSATATASPTPSATAGSPTGSSPAVIASTGETPTPADSLLPATTDSPVASAVGGGASSTPWGAAGGLAVVVLVGGAAWWTMRRGGAR